MKILTFTTMRAGRRRESLTADTFRQPHPIGKPHTPRQIGSPRVCERPGRRSGDLLRCCQLREDQLHLIAPVDREPDEIRIGEVAHGFQR